MDMSNRKWLNDLRAKQPQNEPYDFEDPEFLEHYRNEHYRNNLRARLEIKKNPEVVNIALLNELH